MQNTLLFNSDHDVKSLKHEFDLALNGIKEEFEDHLASINDNTNEIQANHEYLSMLDEKINKLDEKIEQLQFMIKHNGKLPSEDTVKIELTEKEKEVFLSLYTSEKPLTYAEIAKDLRESEFLVRSYITNLIEKGVPVKKRYVKSLPYLSIDVKFKELQARSNVLNITQRSVAEFC
ncbi:MAG: hypothetical protein GY861_06355 [bacterium]|nr:hypothetical protein [bacterium]